MVVRVELHGLNIVRARGKYYVYLRDTGAALLKGFEGSKDDLLKRLEEADTMGLYLAHRRKQKKTAYADGTLGALIQWYKEECPRYQRLSEATKKDYRAAFDYLVSEWDAPLDTITQHALYETRDTCAKKKWPRFADKMISALSSMFSEAAKRGKMTANPAKGIEKAHKADRNANREWTAEEWEAVRKKAPQHILIPLMIARYAGFRGQTIATLKWSQYQADSRTGKCFRFHARKNEEDGWIPVVPELRAFLDGIERTALHEIATKKDGSPWKNEVQMQTAVSHFLKKLERDGVVGEGVTLHGLRVTYAAELRRWGADTGSVAAALGDRSERMGAHYTRHVENEAKVIRAFSGRTQNTVLQNAKEKLQNND